MKLTRRLDFGQDRLCALSDDAASLALHLAVISLTTRPTPHPPERNLATATWIVYATQAVLSDLYTDLDPKTRPASAIPGVQAARAGLRILHQLVESSYDGELVLRYQHPGISSLTAVTVLPSVCGVLWLIFAETLYDHVYGAATRGDLVSANGYLEETAVVRCVCVAVRDHLPLIIVFVWDYWAAMSAS